MMRSKLLLAAFCAALVPVGASAQQAQPQRPAGPILTPMGRQPTEVLIAKILVSDMVKSYRFYTQIIGLRHAWPEDVPMPPDPVPGRPEPEHEEIALNFSGSLADAFIDITTKRGVKPNPEFAHNIWIAFKVPDAAAAVRRVKAAGYEVIREAPQTPAGQLTAGMVRDPDGYTIELIQAADYKGKK